MTPAELVTLLTGDSALNALVGGRVYPSTAPEGATRPFVVYIVSNRRGVQQLNGPELFVRRRYQISAWAETPDRAEEVSEAVIDALQEQGYLIGASDARDPETMDFGVHVDWST